MILELVHISTYIIMSSPIILYRNRYINDIYFIEYYIK